VCANGPQIVAAADVVDFHETLPHNASERIHIEFSRRFNLSALA